MIGSGLRRVLIPGVTAILLAGGLAGVTAARAAAASGSSSCFPAMDTSFGDGAFTATTNGTGVVDVVLEPGGSLGSDLEGTGRLSWSAKQTVTGNTGGSGTMSGSLSMSLALDSHVVSFVSSCILEAGVFAGESEDDPFDPGTFHTAIKGVEGEWIGTAYNLIRPGSSTQVVASLAAWTTDAGPRFKVDIVGGDFSNPTQCPIEDNTSTTPTASAGGPTTATGNNVLVTGPNMRAGRGSCS